jgi:hypothetical protein
LATTLVGSFPQPDWLVNKDILNNRPAPRVEAPEVWKVEAEHRGDAQDAATAMAIKDMEAVRMCEATFIPSPVVNALLCRRAWM